MSGREYTDGYVIRQTDKARLIEIRATEERLWVPRSVTDDIVTQPAADDIKDKLPGLPCVFRVAGWFRRKNHEALGD